VKERDSAPRNSEIGKPATFTSLHLRVMEVATNKLVIDFQEKKDEIYLGPDCSCSIRRCLSSIYGLVVVDDADLL
jgi:hypothetical protein